MSNATSPGPGQSDLGQFRAGLPRTFLFALLATTMLGASAGAWFATASAAASAAPITVSNANPQPGFAPLVSKVKPAVVQISTISSLKQDSAYTGDGDSDGQAQPQADDDQAMPGLPPEFQQLFRNFGGGRGGMNMTPGREQRALGSGFIIDPAGYIVTNNHVVDGAREVSVTLTDGNKYKAKVIGRDAKTDLALVKIDAGHTLPYVAFGDSDGEHEGDWVIAVGNPYGLGGTVTAGIVSAHGRDIHSGPYDDFLQIDAPINPGNSGGPLFNQSGQVVGIDTAIYSPSGGSVGIGFAIPSNVAKQVVAQLRDHGNVARGWLGVSMQPLTPALAHAVGLKDINGVLVDTIQQDSPAQHADLRQGDVITSFGGKAVTDARDLAMAVANTPSGQKVEMTVWRDGSSHNLPVTVGNETAKTQVASAASANAPAALPHPVGMSLAPLTADAKSQFNLDAQTAGVLVNQVTPGGHADDSGVQAGDVILRVNGDKVSSPDQVVNAIRTAEQHNKSAIALQVMRGGQASYLGLQLA
jgi:serine protease Do